MFIGIDHGTTSMRFASSGGKVFSILRQIAATMPGNELLQSILQGLEVSKNDIKMMAVTYSMGDGIDHITPIDRVPDRGITSRDGAGLHVGGGTHVYDTIKDSGIPAIVIPGLHRGNTPDARFNVFSHGASPEKLGITYHAHKMGYDNFIVSDISSNTVTLAAADGRLLGAIDACIFAPGIHHGPLDLAAIRDVDAGLYSANEAFTRAGVVRMSGHSGIYELLDDFNNGNEKAILAIDTLALFASMEIVSMTLPLKEIGVYRPEVLISGSISEIQYAKERIEDHIGCKVKSLGMWSAAKGCACIAEDVFNGAGHILGIGIDA